MGNSEPTGACWYRQPILWLGALILAASLAGCMLMIVLAGIFADTPEPTAGREVMQMPLARMPDTRAAPERAER